MDARKRGLIIDIGGFVFPNAAGASLGPLDGRHLARVSGTVGRFRDWRADQ